MLRLFGAVLIIGATSMAGFVWAERLSDRCELLKSWLRLLDILQTEIGYQTRMLPEIFLQMAQLSYDDYLGESLRKCAGELKFGSGKGVAEVWEQLVFSRAEFLTNGDLEILLGLGNYLGSTDRADQVNRIKVCMANLELNLKEAESKKKTKSNLYRYLGFACGAVVVLWLI